MVSLDTSGIIGGSGGAGGAVDVPGGGAVVQAGGGADGVLHWSTRSSYRSLEIEL